MIPREKQNLVANAVVALAVLAALRVLTSFGGVVEVYNRRRRHSRHTICLRTGVSVSRCTERSSHSHN